VFNGLFIIRVFFWCAYVYPIEALLRVRTDDNGVDVCVCACVCVCVCVCVCACMCVSNRGPAVCKD